MKKVALIFLALAFLIISLVGGMVWWLFQPVSQETVEATRFVVPKGQAISIIGNRLTEAGYLKHSLIFRFVVKQQNLADKIQAGSFMISPTMTPAEIAETLTSGSEDVWVTIPEGLRREEIAENLAEAELPLYTAEEFLDATAGLEGRLFPETYLIPRDYTAQQIVTLLTNTFDSKVTKGLAAEIETSDYSLDEALVMASLVEREANGDAEMPMVAGILWNRISIGMALQVDATLQYAKGQADTATGWWVPPLAADKQLDSPFNTYQNPGLPPRPIANPGLAAIKAALQPAESDYLFYIHDTRGTIHYAETLDEHNANINSYLR